ncbi:DHS-like NAD/FAD-binding domain-containing protein [Xylaria arbuscula]|uniref:Deacetylase sirtuin-type domain-containing protein n=1 Tax=Xylaria arbuscula TaxID=114810 RepID=A0A9W8TLI2_9PEZI|nr:DHS-like NAD/FAD-binding domain-containing protein [Xylaria arbuscula]KAJ3568651.1 hypothetical protein NPX13_g6346 [Xylaria arbuscula]
MDGVSKDSLTKLEDVLSTKKRILVITGAGIPVAAGIPAFRGSGGVFKSLQKELGLSTSAQDLFDLSDKASPTRFHYLPQGIAQEGRLLRLYTKTSTI